MQVSFPSSFETVQFSRLHRFIFFSGRNIPVSPEFTTGVVARDDDHLVRHFFHSAPSLDELKSWFKNPDNADGIIASLQELSDRVDKGFD